MAMAPIQERRARRRHVRTAALTVCVALPCASLGGCGGTARQTPHKRIIVRAPIASTTTVPVDDPARHDTTVINKTIHDLNTTTTITLPRTQ